MSLQQKAVVFDIDGVLAEFVLPFKSFVNNYIPYRIAPTGAQQDWQYRGMSRAEWDDVWQHVRAGKWDWSTLPSLLTVGDTYAIQELRKTGQVTFEYVTNREGPQVQAQTAAWLSREGLPQGRISVVADKVDFITKNVPNVFAIIEDSPANIIKYVDGGLGDKLYVRDWPYNREGSLLRDGTHLDELDYKARVSSVAEFCYAVITAITNRDPETGARLGKVEDPIGTPKKD